MDSTNKIIFAIIVFLTVVLTNSKCEAQHRAVNAGIYTGYGVYSILKSDDFLNQGSIYALSFSHYSFRNLGLKTGISYIKDLEEDIDILFVPVNMSWRTRKDRRNLSQRVGHAMDSYIEDDNTILGSILTMLPLQFEISAGVSPGYIFGTDYECNVWSSIHGDYVDRIIIKNRFCLTADFGIGIYLNIWKLTAMIRPEYHYMITDNFERRATLKSLNKPISRSYISFNAGIGFAF